VAGDPRHLRLGPPDDRRTPGPRTPRRGRRRNPHPDGLRSPRRSRILARPAGSRARPHVHHSPDARRRQPHCTLPAWREHVAALVRHHQAANGERRNAARRAPQVTARAVQGRGRSRQAAERLFRLVVPLRRLQVTAFSTQAAAVRARLTGLILTKSSITWCTTNYLTGKLIGQLRQLFTALSRLLHLQRSAVLFVTTREHWEAADVSMKPHFCGISTTGMRPPWTMFPQLTSCGNGQL
jgi:hypothetical protein